MRRCLWAVCATWLALSPCAATAAQPRTGSADEADVQFRLGNEAYLAKDYEKALAHYFASNRLAPNRNVVFNVARCYEKLGRFVEAYRYYEAYRAAGTGEDAQLAKAMARIRPKVALLAITSEPPGATIYVDRQDLGAYGQTPRVLAVQPGAHTVILERAGYAPAQLKGVAVKLGGRVDVSLELTRLTGTLKVTGSPAGATITVEDPDGPVVGTLGASLDVPAGRHNVVISHPGYRRQERELTLAPREARELKVELEPSTGTVVVDADEPGAMILVDDEPVGFTPSVVEVAAGEHVLRVRLQGFKGFERKVAVAEGDKVAVTAELPISDEIEAASRVKESVAEAPMSVTLITRPEMDAFGYTTLGDALRGVRGIFLSDDGTYRYAGIRGFSPFGEYGNRVLVQLDGHTLNDDWLGSSYIDADLMVGLHALDRIEVVRGPGSALYGTGAFFGVLNLVTPRRADRAGARLGASMIDHATFRGYGEVTVPLGKDAGVWVYGGGLYRQPREYLSEARIEAGEPGRATGVDETVAGTVLGKAWWKDLTLQWYFNDRDKQIPNASFETLFGDPRTRSGDRRAFGEIRFEPRLSELAELRTRLYYDHYRYEGAYAYADDEGGVASESYEGHAVGAEVRAVLHVLDKSRVSVGGDYQYHFGGETYGRSALEAEPYVDEHNPFHQFSVFATTDLELVDWFGLSAGVRLDGWDVAGLPEDGGGTTDRFFWTINPKLTLRFHPVPDGTLKLMGGRAFRAPSVYELTYWDGGLTQIQSPQLEPETIWSGEIEYTHRLPADFWITGAAYLNHYTSLIELTGAGDDADPFQFRNLPEEVWTLGAELEVRKRFRKGSMLALQYSFQHTRAGDPIDGDEVLNSPAHLAGLKVIVPLIGKELRLASRLTVGSGRLRRDGERTDPVVLWDLMLSGQVQTLRMQYAVGVRNLLNWDYGHPVGEDVRDPTVPQPGLSIVADLSFGF